MTVSSLGSENERWNAPKIEGKEGNITRDMDSCEDDETEILNKFNIFFFVSFLC